MKNNHRFPHCVVFVSGCLQRRGQPETDLQWVGFHLSLLDLGRTQRKKRHNRQRKIMLREKMHVSSGCVKSVRVAVPRHMKMTLRTLWSQGPMTRKKRTRKTARSPWLVPVRWMVTGIFESSQSCYLWNQIKCQASLSCIFVFTELLLNVRSINLMKSKSGENRTEHHTNHYHSNNFIIRRGQNFQMWVTLSRPFNPNTDKLHLELKTG